MSAVSVIIPTYNRAELAARAVASALAQCRPGDEVVVIDDGSTDGTEARLAAFGSRIVYRKIPNGGPGRARNAGLDLARGDYAAFLDSDDEWLPGKLELQRRLLDARPEIAFCFTDMIGAYADGSRRRRLTRHYSGRDLSSGFLGPAIPYSALAALPEGVADFAVHVGDLYPEQMRHGFVQVGTLLARRSLTGPGGARFAEAVRFTEDSEFFALLARRGPAAYLDAELEVFHEHAGARLTDLDDLERSERRLEFLARMWGADSAFLAEHGAAYREAVDAERRLKIRVLLAAGRAADARAELVHLARAPASYRVLALLPGPLTAFVARLARALR